MKFKAVRFMSLLAVMVVCFFLLQASVRAAQGPDAKPQTVPDLLNIAKNITRDPEVRCDAIRKLSGVSEADERNFAVSIALIDVVKASRDPFVPVTAVRALTSICKNSTKTAKTKYIKAFTEILLKKDALPGVRAAIAENYRETLEAGELNDNDAFKALVTIAKNTAEQNLSLRGKCIEAIGSFGIGGPGGLELLGALLSENDPYIKESAATAITLLLTKDPSSGKDVPLAACNKLLELMRDDKLADDLRTKVILVVGQMIAGGNTAANRGLEDIIKIVKNTKNDQLMLAAVEALGVVGTPQAAAPLIGAFTDYNQPSSTTADVDATIRRAIVRACRSILSVQADKPNPDVETVKNVSTLLIAVLDAKAERLPVKESAVYALGYLYPKKFEANHKEAVGALIFLLKNATEASLKVMLPDTLEAITGVNFGQDWKRWVDWAVKKYPGIALDAPAPK